MSFERFSNPESASVYVNTMRPIFNKRALFSDTTAEYIIPSEPNLYGVVAIRFRAGKNNVDRVFLVNKDEKHLMTKVDTEGEFDYYELRVQLDHVEYFYYFEIVAGKITSFYDRRGIIKDVQEHYYFSVIPGFKTPDWAKGAVMYQIYVDRFYNGDKTNDVENNEYYYIGAGTTRVEDWNKLPAVMGIREFYGGDLQGVIDKMDYLKGLGIEAIYFNPLFVSPSNHKYDIQDYDNIDPHLGKIVEDGGEPLEPHVNENRFASKYIKRVTSKANLEASNDLFKKVVEEAHKRNIKVILDGVFNHCGSFNKWIDKERIYEDAEGFAEGAYIAENSPFHDFFKFHGGNWPYNTTYDGWWGHDTLPKLNYEGSSNLYNYILQIGRKWVSPPYNADGWRLDVAADLGHSPDFNHRFWQDFRKAVKSANPNAIIIAEHYGNPRNWLRGNEWDTVMNYDAFMEPITWFLTGMQKHSDDYREDLYGNTESFWGAMKHHMANFPGTSLQVSMNELSNHDHSRFLTRTNKKVGRINTLGSHAASEGINRAVMREAVLMQMTWPGAPTVYYGDEAGVCGFTDPDNRRTYPWGNEDNELIAYHRELIRIRKENKELRTGSIRALAETHNVLTYGRFNASGSSVIILNNNKSETVVELSVWEVNIPREARLHQLVMTTNEGYTLEAKEYVVEKGKLKLTIPGTSAMILKYKGEKTKKKSMIDSQSVTEKKSGGILGWKQFGIK